MGILVFRGLGSLCGLLVSVVRERTRCLKLVQLSYVSQNKYRKFLLTFAKNMRGRSFIPVLFCCQWVSSSFLIYFITVSTRLSSFSCSSFSKPVYSSLETDFKRIPFKQGISIYASRITHTHTHTMAHYFIDSTYVHIYQFHNTTSASPCDRNHIKPYLDKTTVPKYEVS